MTTVVLIFPHQLFTDHPCTEKGRVVYLIEEWLFFRQYPFHQQKLLLHRASMKKYAHYLSQQDVTVNYIDSQYDLSDVRKLINHLAQQNITGVLFADVADNWLKTRIENTCNKHCIKIVEAPSPNLLNTSDDVKAFLRCAWPGPSRRRAAAPRSSCRTNHFHKILSFAARNDVLLE